MSQILSLPPRAACLSTSLRDLGYSLETAVADLIDNSISADAHDIRIFCEINRKDPVLAVIDDGHGMTQLEVISAMRHGSANPRGQRSPEDLGRFGLGLKTASFSQCRRLTVISRRDGKDSAVEWDLARVISSDTWDATILDQDEIDKLPFIEQLPATGTLVLWRDLDRLLEDENGQKRNEIVNEKLAVLEAHLSLVFHRFLSGDVAGRKKVTIHRNNHPIKPFDPFCRKNPATQVLPAETLWIRDQPVHIQPYILPHYSRLTATEYDFYRKRSEFITNQGAYIYRNGRLMAWGDWFRLVPKNEATKLARVQIDFTNDLDEAWTIDIKKSRARPPHAVRERLSQIISRITDRSVSVHRGRGQKLLGETPSPLWERHADRHGIHYTINMNHPLVQALQKELTAENTAIFNLLMKALPAALPVEMIYSDYSTHPHETFQESGEEAGTVDRLHDLQKVLFGNAPGDRTIFMKTVRSTGLFKNQPDLLEEYVKEHFA